MLFCLGSRNLWQCILLQLSRGYSSVTVEQFTCWRFLVWQVKGLFQMTFPRGATLIHSIFVLSRIFCCVRLSRRGKFPLLGLRFWSWVSVQFLFSMRQWWLQLQYYYFATYRGVKLFNTNLRGVFLITTTFLHKVVVQRSLVKTWKSKIFQDVDFPPNLWICVENLGTTKKKVKEWLAHECFLWWLMVGGSNVSVILLQCSPSGYALWLLKTSDKRV